MSRSLLNAGEQQPRATRSTPTPGKRSPSAWRRDNTSRTSTRCQLACGSAACPSAPSTVCRAFLTGAFAYVIKVDRRLAHSKERAMREEKITAERLAAYSDAVFAVIVTIMVLELKAPDQPGFPALWPLWPTAISYAVSYLFIAIIWINHDYLMRFVGRPTLGLIWINFVHLFMVSFLPFATAWIARTRLASSAVVFYAGLFVCIDIAYNVFEREVLVPVDDTQVSERTRRVARS